MQDYAINSIGETHQNEKAKKGQKKNSAGGYSFKLDDFARLRRFLILGSDSNTFYATKQKLTQENVKSLDKALGKDYVRAIDTIVDINVQGLAPKVDSQIFALAYASVNGKKDVRKYALSHLTKVCRTGTHLFMFLQYRKQLGGKWGTLMREAVKAWYNQPVDKVALQVVKYRNREGWTHLDALRLSHPTPASEVQDAIFKFAKDGTVSSAAPAIIHDHFRMSHATSNNDVIDIIKEVPGIPRESIPTQYLKDPLVWESMLPGMPMTAMIRNIRNMAKYGVFNNKKNVDIVCDKLTSEDLIRKARVHPIHILLALGAYKPFNGSADHPVNMKIVGALDEAFHLAFHNAEPTGKRILIGLDVSSSMDWGEVATGITPCVASSAMCLVTAATENCEIYGFTTSFRRMKFNRGYSIEQAIRETKSMSFGGTDCSLPMEYARKYKKKVDAFIIYTDSETWAGRIHPFQSLKKYRAETGINAKLIVVGMVSNGFTIADPSDPGMLDVVGFDASAPVLMNNFIKGL